MKTDGGTAFACCCDSGGQEGMTLRDYFAGQAVTGLLANEAILVGLGERQVEGLGDADNDVALAAYQVADSMLAEREKES